MPSFQVVPLYSTLLYFQIFYIPHMAYKHFMNPAFIILTLSGFCVSQLMDLYDTPLSGSFSESHRLVDSSSSTQGYSETSYENPTPAEKLAPAADGSTVGLMTLDDYAHTWLQNYEKYRSVPNYLSDIEVYDDERAALKVASEDSSHRDANYENSERITPDLGTPILYNKRDLNHSTPVNDLANGSGAFNYRSLATFSGTIALAMTVLF